jgi:hypothetical protein
MNSIEGAMKVEGTALEPGRSAARGAARGRTVRNMTRDRYGDR